MNAPLRKIHKSKIAGTIAVPASKSHMVRALLISGFADGTSHLRNPLVSSDTISCRKAIETLGRDVQDDNGDWVVTGNSKPVAHPTTVDVGNSGTTLYLATAFASLGRAEISFDGDSSIRQRSAAPLLAALRELGASADSDDRGCTPYTVKGPIAGGECSLNAPTSQYLSALLLSAPLASAGETIIEVLELNEKPYVDMTLGWLDSQGILYNRNGYDRFVIPGKQSYRPFDLLIPGDYSSATFFLCAAALSGCELTLTGLNPDDTQGDRKIVAMLREMGCIIEENKERTIIKGGKLSGATLNLNDTPDALPALAVTACFARGETRLVNVAQARIKETDRIAVMAHELRKIGGVIEERPDGLIITGGKALHGGRVSAHGDHRIAMALAIAGLGTKDPIEVMGSECAEITYPNFFGELDRIAGVKNR